MILSNPIETPGFEPAALTAHAHSHSVRCSGALCQVILADIHGKENSV